MADESGIDSRYAAQFQRGYDAALEQAPPAWRGPVRLEGGPPPSAPRVPDPPRMTPDPAIAEELDALSPTPLAEADPPAPIPLTWWDWLLPVLGVGLIVIALMLLWTLGTDTSGYYGTRSNDEWATFVQQLRYVLPGPLLTAGVLAVTGGIVLQAVRPK